MSKISLQMYTMREFTKTKEDLESCVKELSEIGFKNLQYTVQPFMTVKETKELFDKYDIKEDSDCISFYQIKDNLKRVEDGAKYFNTPYLRTDSMPREMTTVDGIKKFCQEANEIGELLAPFGQKLLYHFHSYEFKNFDGFNGIDLFIKELDHSLVHFQPDTHWLQSGGVNPAEFIKENSDMITYVHVKDYAIGDREELLESTPKLYAPVGCGNLNWKSIISACRDINCKMYVIEQDNCYGENPYKCVETSFKNLNMFGVE